MSWLFSIKSSNAIQSPFSLRTKHFVNRKTVYPKTKFQLSVLSTVVQFDSLFTTLYRISNNNYYAGIGSAGSQKYNDKSVLFVAKKLK